MRLLLRAIWLPATVLLMVLGWLWLDALVGWRGLQLLWAGRLLVLTGLLLAAWCVVLFGAIGKGTPHPFVAKTKRLVVVGPYAYVRNPMIWAVGIILVGLALWLGSVGLWLGFLAFLTFVRWFVPRVEEPDLERRFGEDYRAYCRRVPRWLPRLRRPGGAIGAEFSEKISSPGTDLYQNESTEMTQTDETLKEKLRAAYGEVARTRDAETAAACCAPPGYAPDYTPEEIASVPDGAFLGEGSGNPVRAAALRRGEKVIDLGCGAGMDVFLAANQVGPGGQVIGVDMTPEMLERARVNASRGNYSQVAFVQSEIERLPLATASADAVLSNCVINLAPDKAAVYRETYRVLKPGGRFAIADIVLRGEPGAIHKALAECVPGSCLGTASEQNRYLETIQAAGFEEVKLVSERPAMAQPLQNLVRSYAVTLVGRKPAA